jgi:hypothetical protein
LYLLWGNGLAQSAAAQTSATASSQTVLHVPERSQTPDSLSTIGVLSGPIEIEGRVRIVLHDGRGDVNGVLLEDGTVLRLSTTAATLYSDLLRCGQTIAAEGVEFSSPFGKALEVRRIGPSRTELNLVADRLRSRAPGNPPPAEVFA